MVLENPALSLNVKVQDILAILENILKEKNWKDFELASIKLVYTPFYLFNYDILFQDSEKEPTKGSSGTMALNAVNGKLEPMVIELIEKQPVTYEKQISHDIQYEIEPTAITKEELKESGRMKIAAQLGIKKDSVSISGIRTVYWPTWNIFVEIPAGVYKVEVDGVSGVPLNIEEVPTREKGWLEVTAETLQKMKSPRGWAELSGTLASVAGSKLSSGVSKMGSQAKEGSKTYNTIKWFTTTKIGIYSLILVLILILVLVYK